MKFSNTCRFARQGHSSQWWLTRPCSAPYAAGAMKPCMCILWRFSSWEICRICLVDIVVLTMGLQTPSVHSVLSLTPPLETRCSIQWLSASILLCIFQALKEFLMRQLYQAPVSKHFLASTIVSGFGDYMGWIHKCGSLCSILCISSGEYFVPPSKKDWSIHTFVFLLLELHVVCELCLQYSKLLG